MRQALDEKGQSHAFFVPGFLNNSLVLWKLGSCTFAKGKKLHGFQSTRELQLPCFQRTEESGLPSFQSTGESQLPSFLST